MAESMDVFTVDIEAFREEQLGRPPHALIKEAVQNALDAAKSKVSVYVTPAKEGRGYLVEVLDDGPGFADLRAAWTFFMSGKRDNPTLRGRMGRGLKELLAVSDHASIQSTGGAVEFTREAKGKWVRASYPRRKRSEGTLLAVTVRGARWSQSDVNDAVEFLQAILPPEGVEVTVNGVANAMPPQGDEFQMKLQTVVYEGEQERRRRRETTVTLFKRRDGQAWLYELGIPVQPVEFEKSINVAQRIPLKAHRDVADPDWLRELYAELLNRLHDTLDRDALTSAWATEAAQAGDKLSPDAKRSLRDAYLPEGVMVANTLEEAKTAEGFGRRAVLPSAIPMGVRSVVREVAPKAKDFVASIQSVETYEVPFTKLSADEQRLVTTWQKLVTLAGYRQRISVHHGRITHGALGGPTEVQLYRQVLGKKFFTEPLAPDRLRLLVHELAHEGHASHDHVHGVEFKSDVERVAGRLIAAAIEHADELTAIAADKEHAEP